MQLGIYKERGKLSQRTRGAIERFLRGAFRRERREILRIDLTIAPNTIDGEDACRVKLQIRSRSLGLIVVNDFGSSLRTATQQATARGRKAFRRRRHKRLARFRRLRRGAPISVK